MAKVLVGRDVAAYTFAPAGTDGVPSLSGFNLGSSTSLLGKYKSISVELEDSWDDVSPSSASLKEKRKIISDWSATIENQIRSGGSPGLTTMLLYDYIQFVFLEETNGKTITLYAGIMKTSYKREKGEGIESINVENVGDIAGLGSSIFYN